MLVVFRKPLACSLVLSIVFLIFPSVVTSSSPWMATLRPRGHRSVFSDYQQDEDYTNVSDEPVSVPAPTRNPLAPHCNYNPCLDQQEPCRLMALAQDCSCPGMSGEHDVPEPPHLVRLWRGAPGGVLVHWCAPASYVITYRVSVKGQEKQREVGERTRVLDLGEVPDGAEVCVEAVNKAGVSELASHSCTRFKLHTSESSLALKLGLIVGAVVLLMMLALALVLWRLRTFWNCHTRAETCGGGDIL